MIDMRKIFHTLLASLAVVGTYTACTPEVDDVFDKSSAERVKEALTKNQQILVSAPNGWRMAMYGNKDFGGYNVFLKFAADNTVEVASEKTVDTEAETQAKIDSSANVRQTSHYKLEQSGGIILSFDEYNRLFHYFSDPVNPDGYGTRGKGFEADLEYRILSASADSVVLSGKKHGNKLIMLPVADGTNISQYMKDALNVEAAMLNANFKISVDTLEYPVQVTGRNMKIVTTTETGDRLDVKCPFVVTTQGYEFYETVTLAGHQLKGFKYVAGQDEYLALNDESVKLSKVYPPINEQFVSTVWFTSFSNLGSFGQSYWNYLNTSLMPIINGSYPGTLDYCYFGIEDGKFGLWYMIINYWGLNGFDYKLIGEDEITLTYNSKKNDYNADTFTGSGFLYAAAYIVAPFGCDQQGKPVSRTFKITTDNQKNPTWVVLTDKDNPDNTIRLTAAEISGDLFNK